MFTNARLAQLLNEWETAPIHPRHFVGIELDLYVLNSKSGESTEAVLNRLDRDRTVAQGSPPATLGHVVDMGGDSNRRRLVDTYEPDPGMRLTRAHAHRHRLAGEQTPAVDLNLTTYRVLMLQGVSPAQPSP